MARPKPPAAALVASPDDIEQQFYEALQRGDIDKLMAVWSDDDEITCVHPGGPRVVGLAAIRSAFEGLLAHGAMDVRPEKVRRLQAQGSAVHSVVERVRINTGDGAQTAWVLATNVYVKGTQGWRLVSHHASPGFSHDVAEANETPSVLH
jgi:ketosteroid isomerase-like protein